MKTFITIITLLNYVAIINLAYILTYEPFTIDIDNAFIVLIMHILVAVLMTFTRLTKQRAS
jgi:hypothetical protein